MGFKQYPCGESNPYVTLRGHTLYGLGHTGQGLAMGIKDVLGSLVCGEAGND